MTGAQGPPVRRERPLFFVHVMRCGGTSLRAMLWRAVDQTRVWPTQAEITRNASRYPEHEEALALPRDFFLDVDLVSGHYPWILAEHLPRRPQVITFLRDPVARTLSHLRRHTRVHALDRDRAMLDLLDDERFTGASVRDYQVRYFAWRSLGERASVNHALPIDAGRLELAEQRLASCDVVGVTERFDESLRVLGEATGIDVTDELHVNRTDEKPEEAPTDAVLERILELTEHDRAFVATANRLLDERLARLGHDDHLARTPVGVTPPA